MVSSPVLVSIVIPTSGRPRYLARALRSALEWQGTSVEVIVLPNGDDTSWREALQPWQADRRVHVSTIATANVSAARNHGMALAQGKYLRFLDDDDYLLPAAEAQLEEIERTRADVCSGLLSNVDEDGVTYSTNSVPATTDFVCAAASISGFRLPHGNLWRRSAIQTCPWDPLIREGEDYAWMLDLAAVRDWHWVRCDNPVGIWFQHSGPRGSSVRRPTGRKERIISHLLSLHHRLDTAKQLTTERRAAIADGLWHYIHTGFPSHPVYWSTLARRALSISSASRPRDHFYTHGPLRSVDPIVGEWAMLPVRHATRVLRSASRLWRDADYRRQL